MKTAKDYFGNEIKIGSPVVYGVDYAKPKMKRGKIVKMESTEYGGTATIENRSLVESSKYVKRDCLDIIGLNPLLENTVAREGDIVTYFVGYYASKIVEPSDGVVKSILPDGIKIINAKGNVIFRKNGQYLVSTVKEAL